MITVSETAAKKVKSLIEESGFKTPYLRVAVKGVVVDYPMIYRLIVTKILRTLFQKIRV